MMIGPTKSAIYWIRILSNFRGYSTSSLMSGVDIRSKKHQPVAGCCVSFHSEAYAARNHLSASIHSLGLRAKARQRSQLDREPTYLGSLTDGIARPREDRVKY